MAVPQSYCGAVSERASDSLSLTVGHGWSNGKTGSTKCPGLELQGPEKREASVAEA